MPRDAQGHLVPGRISPALPIPASIPRPEYVGRPGPREYTGSDVYSPEQVELIRESGRIAAQAIEAVGAAIRPGVTTDELDVIAHEFIVGTASPDAAALVERTQEALARGIKAVAPGRQINVIGRAIESYAKRFGYGVVRDFTGHGVGAALRF